MPVKVPFSLDSRALSHQSDTLLSEKEECHAYSLLKDGSVEFGRRYMLRNKISLLNSEQTAYPFIQSLHPLGKKLMGIGMIQLEYNLPVLFLTGMLSVC